MPESLEPLRLRDFTVGDIPQVATYWASQTPDDFARLSVDPGKIAAMIAGLAAPLQLPSNVRVTERLMWQLSGRTVGMSSLVNIRFGEYGEIHLHLMEPRFRRLGYGHQFFAMSLQEFFRRFELALIVCEPSAANPGPNRLLQKLGLSITRTYRTIPSVVNVEHVVNRYEITRHHLSHLPAQGT
jgi:RimJ/RimL family protein N-acetyltransferase